MTLNEAAPLPAKRLWSLTAQGIAPSEKIMYASALKTPLLPFRKRGTSISLHLGAALGNPEMAGHQTVRARTKNAFLLGQKSES